MPASDRSDEAKKARIRQHIRSAEREAERLLAEGHVRLADLRARDAECLRRYLDPAEAEAIRPGGVRNSRVTQTTVVRGSRVARRIEASAEGWSRGE